MSERVRLRRGGGLLGTGVYLLGQRAAGADAWDARAWVSLLFVPIVPLQAARFRGPSEGPTGEPWDVERTSLEVPSRRDVGKTYGAAVGLVLLTLSPVGLAWWTIHQTGLLQALKVVMASSVPILVLMWRDLRAPRVVR
jgi:hypothetical protein